MKEMASSKPMFSKYFQMKHAPRPVLRLVLLLFLVSSLPIPKPLSFISKGLESLLVAGECCHHYIIHTPIK